MSQSQNRRPSRTREPPRKAPTDYVTNNTKENVGTKDTYKIPKNVRYDLENALVGLCDVWFEEIKPHLVKNNLKLHTGGALNEGGYRDLEPAREPWSGHEEPRRGGRALIDPGASSHTRRRPAASSGVCSPTRPAASRAPCPKPPSRTRPISPTNLRKILQLPDDERTQTPARRASAAPDQSPPLTKNYQRNVRSSSNQLPNNERTQTLLTRRVAAPDQSPPLTNNYQKYQRNVRNSSNQLPKNERTQTPVRRVAAPDESPPLTNNYQKYQRNVRNSSNQLPNNERTQTPVRRVAAPDQSPPLTNTYQKYQRNVRNSSNQLPNNERTQTPARRVAAPDQSPPSNQPDAVQKKIPRDLPLPLAQTYQPKIHTSSKQHYLEKAPPHRSTAVLAQTYHDYRLRIKNVHNPSETTLENLSMRPLRWRGPMRAPSPSMIQFCQQNFQDSRVLKQNRKKRKTAWTRRTPSSQPPSKRIVRPCCTACALAKAQTNNIQLHSRAATAQLPLTKITPPKPCSNNKNAFFLRWPDPKFPHSSVPTQDRGVITDLSLFANSISPAGDVPRTSLHVAAGDPSFSHRGPKPCSRNPTNDQPSIATSRFRKKSPSSLHHACALSSPLHAKCLSPPEHPIALPRNNQPATTTFLPAPSEDETWFLRVFEEYTRPQKPKNPSIRKGKLSEHNTCTASKHTIPIHNENKLLLEDKSSLFSKDLIDLIVDKNDERVKVLYENPSGQESRPSTMCLVGSRKKRVKTTPKKMPWR